MNLLHLNPKDLASGIGIYSDTGGGKSSTIKQILLEIERLGDVAVVSDPDREYARAFRSVKRGDWVLDPSVEECPSWHWGKECKSRAEATALAACQFPDDPNVKDPFWYLSSRQTTALLLDQYQPTTAEYVNWVENDEELDKRVAGTSLERILTKNVPGMRSSIIAHLATASESLRLMPNEAAGRRQFLISDWCEKRDSWIFMTGKPQHSVAMRPLFTMWNSTLMMKISAMGRRKDLRRVWFIWDELADAPPQEAPMGLRRLRKTDSPVVYAIQNFADLEVAFGKKAESMFSSPKTKIIFRTSNPDSARKLEATVGKKTVETMVETRSWGRGGYSRSWSMKKEKEPVISADEIMNWEDREFVLLQPGVAVKGKMPIVDLQDRLPLIEERAIPPMEHRELEPEVKTVPLVA